jgi:hypothetical protein
MSSPIKDSVLSPDNPLNRALILVVERNAAGQRLERFFLEQAHAPDTENARQRS